jgi:glycosyltransferase involved in cell wall biosynthesis
MKVLYFINGIKNNGGIERVVIDKINYLSEVCKYDISLAYFGTKVDQPFFKISPMIHLIPLGNVSSGHYVLERIKMTIILGNRVKKLIKAVCPDVIDNANAIIISWILPFLFTHIPKIVELHFSYDGLMIMNKQIYHNNKFLIFINNSLRKVLYPRYDQCVVLTNDDKVEWGFKNLIVIPNYSAISRATKEDFLMQKRNSALFVGRLESEKDPLILVQAWKFVYQKHPDWKLEIWGNGSLRNLVLKQIHILGLDNVVSLNGVTDHIREEYLKARFFVLPSLYEGMPLCLLEAMQQGLPCISFEISGVSDIMDDGKNGYIVKEHTAKALAFAINKLIENPYKLNSFSVEAYKSVEKFDKKKIMKKWTVLFEKLRNNPTK